MIPIASRPPLYWSMMTLPEPPMRAHRTVVLSP